ncbi:MAG: hypothetical protein AB7L90_15400 [Hyphomicrobiaceae bacterium]
MLRNARNAARGAISSIILVASVGTPGEAEAQEYCVTCKSPAALYRCVLERAAPTGIPLKLLCIKTLARQGGHATCSVRSGTVFDCDAPIRRIDASAAAAKLASPSAGDLGQQDHARVPPPTTPPAPILQPGSAPAPERPGGPPPVDGAGQAAGNRPLPTGPPRPSPGPPATVEELAGDISRSSKDALGKTGDAIKTTTKKTWDCIASLFKRC